MRKLFPIISMIMLVTIVGVALAQVVYDKSVYTSYQVVNLGDTPADIIVNYFDEDGVAQDYMPEYLDVPVGGSITVQQALENDLASGQYAAVISSDQPVAAVSNEQLGVAGTGSSYPPFSSYSGVSQGATEVTLPEIMYNWFGYYTEIYIQNAGSAPAQNITIEFKPTAIGTCVTGVEMSDVLADAGNPLAQYAPRSLSQYAESGLAATGLTGGCAAFNGRFLGSATIYADQPVVVVVNEVVSDKLFTYNGITSGGTKLVAPSYLRNWYGYYASLTLANPNGTDANVQLTYTPSAGSNPMDVIVANKVIPAGKSITIYDGASATADQSDLLLAYPAGSTKRFFGSVIIDSDLPIVGKVNQESTLALGNQAGSYNVNSATDATTKVVVPFIVSNFYGYYSSLTIMTTDGSEANISITYTSDGTFSSVKDASKTYTLSTVNGVLNRYEGASCSGTAQCDLLLDLYWAGLDGKHLFIGSAVIESDGAPIVAFVNAEYAKKSTDPKRDSMYTYNGFNLIP